MGLWDWLVGDGSRVPDDYREAGWHRAKTPVDPDRRKEILRYPDKDDIEFAKKYDAFYGTPTDAYVNGTATIHGVSPNDYQRGHKEYPHYVPGTYRFSAGDAPLMQDQIAAAHLAANRSPLMGLGFDPNVAVWETDPEQQFNISGYTDVLHNGPNIPAHGEYRMGMEDRPKPAPDQPRPKPRTIKEYVTLRYGKDNDRMYIDADARPRKGSVSSVLGHESLHRGIGKLNRETSSPLVGKDNEYTVRREMYRRFADPESKDKDYPDKYVRNNQIEDANVINAISGRYDRMLAELEARAQDRMKRERPMGPR